MSDQLSAANNSAAIPLVEVERDTERVVVNEAALAILEESLRDVPVCPVSVVGLYRTGKSSLLNMLRRELEEELDCYSPTDNDQGFAVGASVARCTRGIWLWGKPLRVKRGDHEIALLLLDTEGIGGLEAEVQYDTRMFALSCLLSANLLYNSMGSIDESAIASLSFVAELSAHIKLQSGARSSSQEGKPEKLPSAVEATEEEEAEALSRHMPWFTWLVRDFSLELESADGGSLTADEYLEQALRPQRVTEPGASERNRLRHALRHFFPNRSCRCLVRPVKQESELQQVDALLPSKRRSQFNAQLSELATHLLGESLSPKTMGQGAPLKGPGYAALLRQMCEAFNAGAVPVLTDAWRHVSKTECAAALQSAKEVLSVKLNKIAKANQNAPIDEPDLEKKLEKIANDARAAFEQRALGEMRQESRGQLERYMKSALNKARRTNRLASERFCQQLADKLHSELVAPCLMDLLANDHKQRQNKLTQVDENNRDSQQSNNNGDLAPMARAEELADVLTAAWRELRARYNRDAKGPAAHEVLLALLETQWPNSCHELAKCLDVRLERQQSTHHKNRLDLKTKLAEFEGKRQASAAVMEEKQRALVDAQMERAELKARLQAANTALTKARAQYSDNSNKLQDTISDLQLQLERANAKASALQDHNSRLQSGGAGPVTRNTRDAQGPNPGASPVVPPEGAKGKNCNCILS